MKTNAICPPERGDSYNIISIDLTGFSPRLDSTLKMTIA